MVGPPGFIRGAVSRDEPSFNDLQMQHLLPPNDRVRPQGVFKSDLMCRDTQTFGNYSLKFPQLEAHPGDYIALQYQENGHVTLLPNSPQKTDSGMIYIYGTTNPHDDDRFVDIHKVWNEEGTGGNGRGMLLKTWSFDDGQCYQLNEGQTSATRQRNYPKAAVQPQGSDLWCQTDIRLPSTTQNTLTIYWVWDFSAPSSPKIPNGKSEFYTSCMDIKLAKENHNYDISFVEGQDLNFAGIKAQLLNHS
ncbi:hypothetical protein AK830_g12600 [Neonectria ditissima]|uniref:DUF7492 domain-containing protein n=1 Tax=Neonectria ditissima TaxID=78410 RepID=A0A0P7AYN1_9HYPO|nr:hypothetical protein AK830_g12600 [Neonectria ditissima]